MERTSAPGFCYCGHRHAFPTTTNWNRIFSPLNCCQVFAMVTGKEHTPSKESQWVKCSWPWPVWKHSRLSQSSRTVKMGVSTEWHLVCTLRLLGAVVCCSLKQPFLALVFQSHMICLLLAFKKCALLPESTDACLSYGLESFSINIDII